VATLHKSKLHSFCSVKPKSGISKKPKMKKITTLFFLACYCLGMNAQFSLATWTFENIATAVPSIPIPASSNSRNAESAYAYLSGGNNNGSPDVCSGSETWATNFWPTGSSRSSSDYLEFEITALDGYDLIVTGFVFSSLLSSSSGARNFDVYYSLDGGSERYLGTGTNSSSFCRLRSFDLNAQTASGGRISFRIYPYGQAPAALAATLRLDNVSIRGQSLLPVSLIEWTGEVQEEGILLQWSTASEQSSDYFSIERRTASTEFEEIDRQTAQGDTQEQTNYSFFDAFPASGSNYYRLKQVDRDGTVHYSEVIVFQFQPQTAVQIFPTLVQTHLKLDLRALEAATAEVRIKDFSGKQVLESSYSPPFDLEDINVGHLRRGMYVLIVETERERVVRKFIRQ
jgi:hypothetical protein